MIYKFIIAAHATSAATKIVVWYTDWW
jgi:hypothetical protein